MGIFWMIFGIIAALVFIVSLVVMKASDTKGPSIILAIVAAVATILSGLFAFNVTNGEGQSKVMVSITGDAQGTITEPGLQGKKPWQKAVNYDIRNQKVSYGSTRGEKNKDADGPQITIQDKEGVSANVDVSVQYSINPEVIETIYKEYGSQDNFENRLIQEVIKSGIRTTAANHGTLEFLNNRGQVQTEVAEFLNEEWKDRGVIVENVALQDIRYPKAVKERFSEAQNARTEVEKANAELERNRIQAESNRVLSESLTSQNLEQLKWETLEKIGKNGNLVVVPEDFNGMLNLPVQTGQ